MAQLRLVGSDLDHRGPPARHCRTTTPRRPSGVSRQKVRRSTLNEAAGAGNPTDYNDYWVRCDKTGGSCANISGANNRTPTCLTVASTSDNTIRVQGHGVEPCRRLTAGNVGADRGGHSSTKPPPPPPAPIAAAVRVAAAQSTSTRSGRRLGYRSTGSRPARRSSAVGRTS